jgi:RNA-binding protein
MMTSKDRAVLRSQANTLETTLMIGKGGVTENVIAEAERLLDARELVKGKVLETAMMDPREVSDLICEQTGADGIQVVGTKFVIYRKSAKLEAERKAKEKAAKAKKSNPVRAGVQARRKKAKEDKQRKQQYFHDAAVQAAIQRRKERDGEM